MSLKVEEGQKMEYVLNTEEVSILTEMALIYWGEQNYKVALEIYQFLVGQYEKSFIKPVFHILDWGMSMGNYGMALEELGYFEKAIGVCRKRIQQTLFAGKGGSLHTSLMVEACNGVQREHNKKLNNGLPILHKVPPKRDYGRYFCILAEKGGTSHGGLTEKLSPFFYAQKQEVNAYGR